MLEKLASSGLGKADAKALYMLELDGKGVQKLDPSFHPVRAMVMPYFEPDGTPSQFFRIRYLDQPPGFAGGAKKPQRYAQPPKTLNEVYLPPIWKKSWTEVLKDPTVAVCITEGELKAACATKNGVPTIGLGGVEVWRSAKHGMPMLPQLEEVEWKERTVVIVFDSDAATNPDVVRAQRQLARALLKRGALVGVAAVPPGKGGVKQGLDDFIVAQGKPGFVTLLEEAQDADGGDALWKMNEDFVVIGNPTMIVDRRSGQRMGHSIFTKVTAANRRHVEYDEKNKGKEVSTAGRWLEWPMRFEASALTYAPGEAKLTDNGAWNTWKGWGCEPERGDVGPWHRLLDFMFKDEPESRQWFERWCAYPLQHPGTKLFTSVVIWGVAHGTGKTLMGYTLKDIYGPNGVEIRNEHLHSGFNEWAEAKQFVIGDEVTGTDRRQDADRIKGMITQEYITINAKYAPTFVIPDRVNYYFTSNHPDAFFLDDSDRRFFIHEVLSSPAPRAMYESYDKWRRGKGASYLFQHLLDLPTGDFNPKQHAPMTKAKEEMQVLVRSDLGAWCRDLLQEPARVLRPLGEKVSKSCDLYTATQLFKAYDPEGSGRATATGVGREMRRAGARQLPVIKTSAGAQRLYIVRNMEKWAGTKTWNPKAAAQHWEESWGPNARRF